MIFNPIGEIETAFVVSGAVSAFCASCVLLTFILFPVMRSRHFMDMIICISCCDLIAASMSILGFPADSSTLCPIQSALNVYFYKASWMWTAMLANQLYNLATKRRFGCSFIQRHIICWTIPLITTLLPLSTNDFGRSDDGTPVGWCFLAGSQTGYVIWFYLSFLSLLLACVILMAYYAIRTFMLYRQLGETRKDLRMTIECIALYPLAMILCWAPNLIFTILTQTVISFNPSIAYCANVLSILASQNGTLTALVFLFKSKESRYRWSKLFCSCSVASGASVDHRRNLIRDTGEFEDSPSLLDSPVTAQPSNVDDIMNEFFHNEERSSFNMAVRPADEALSSRDSAKSKTKTKKKKEADVEASAGAGAGAGGDGDGDGDEERHDSLADSMEIHVSSAIAISAAPKTGGAARAARFDIESTSDAVASSTTSETGWTRFPSKASSMGSANMIDQFISRGVSTGSAGSGAVAKPGRL